MTLGARLNVAEENMSRLVLSLRGLAYRALSPFDQAYGTCTQRSEVPPLWLRRHVGSASAVRFRAAAESAARQLDEILADRIVSSVLDLGCGCGSMVPYFQGRLPLDGQYVGVDIHRGCTEWCSERYCADPRLLFGALPEVYSVASARKYDLVLAKSLFTHLVPSDAADYLKEIRQVLAPNGRLVLTAFLFDRNKDVPSLPYPDLEGRARYRRRWRRQAAVGYERSFFLELLTRSCLEIEDARYWFWPGAHKSITTQDLMVCRAV